jgi:hypothetical protein
VDGSINPGKRDQAPEIVIAEGEIRCTTVVLEEGSLICLRARSRAQRRSKQSLYRRGRGAIAHVAFRKRQFGEATVIIDAGTNREDLGDLLPLRQSAWAQVNIFVTRVQVNRCTKRHCNR